MFAERYGRCARQSWRQHNGQISQVPSFAERNGHSARRRRSVRREEFKAVGEEFWQRKKENKKNPEVRRALPVAVGEAAVTVNQRRDGVKVSPSGGLTLGERSPTARDPALGEERLRRQQIPRASFADGHARRSFRRRFWALRRRFLTLGELAVSSSEYPLCRVFFLPSARKKTLGKPLDTRQRAGFR